MEDKKDNHASDDKKPENWSLSSLDEESRRNLIGFFALLLKVDKRINPDLYAKKS